MKQIVSLCFIILMGLTACRPTHKETSDKRSTLRYATLLEMEVCDSFTHVVVQNAWQHKSPLASYVLVPHQQKVPQHLPEGLLLRTPLRRAVLHSSVHAALLCDLKAENQIAGITDTAYVVSPRLKELFKQGVAPAGSSIQPDIEILHQLRADAVLVSPFENSGHGVLDRAGVPLIECADYMEVSPLARAEWMRFYGRLFGKAETADSLFMVVEKAYNTIKTQIATSGQPRPRVFCDRQTGGVWYQPGGASTMGQWINDAGGQYVWEDNKQSGSLALDLESVYAKAGQADIWLIKYGEPNELTYELLAQEKPAYRHFKAWKERRIFTCNSLYAPFYEEVPFHPERLLANLATIFHPNDSTHKGIYYAPMKE